MDLHDEPGNRAQGPDQAQDRTKARNGRPAAEAGADLAAVRSRYRERLAQKTARRTGNTPPARPASSGSPAPAPAAAAGVRTVRSKSGKIHELGPGARLAYADLEDQDLRGLDLSDADLRHANLVMARLEGTVLNGARLMRANLAGATGVDLAGARLHPFFAAIGAEAAGTVKFIHLDQSEVDSGYGFPRHLQVRPDGEITWLMGNAPNRSNLMPTGIDQMFRSEAQDLRDSRLIAMAMDARGGLWTFGDQTTNYNRPPMGGNGAGFGECLYLCMPSRFQDPPANAAATPDGTLWLAFADGFMGFGHTEGRLHREWGRYPDHCKAAAGLQVVANCADPDLTFIGPEQDALFQFSWTGIRCGQWSGPFFKPAVGAIHGAAFGPGGELYYTHSRPNGVTYVDLSIGMSCQIDTEGPGRVGGDPFALVQGPDGAMWWTEPDANRIGRVDAQDQVEYYDLPQGTHPEELVAGKDGLYFTLRRQFELGFLRVLAAPAPAAEAGAPLESPSPAVAAAESGGWAVSLFKPRPERVSKYPKGKAREAFLEERNRWADQSWEEPQAAEEARPALQPFAPPAGAKAAVGTQEDAGHGPRAAADPAFGAVGGPAADPGLADLSPREQLAALDVHLGSRALEYILKQHGHQRKDGKSQFARPWSSRKALEALIAQGLLDAGNALGRIRPPRHTFDRRGRYLTVCRRQDVGCCHQYGQLLPTDRFMVVTELQDGENGPCHVVVNAYPVSPSLW